MTGLEIIADVAGPLNYSESRPSDVTRILRWANEAQDDMAKHNWPELITHDASFTGESDMYHDLTSLIDPDILRVVDYSVRTDKNRLDPQSKTIIDSYDPQRSYGGLAKFYCAESGMNSFILYPPQYGETFYLDWVTRPARITSAITEDEITFLPPQHELIVTGAVMYGMFFTDNVGTTERMRNKREWRKEIISALGLSQSIKKKPRLITPTRF